MESGTKPITPLQRAIDRADLSQRQVARKADLPDAQVNRYARGTNVPSLFIARRIVAAMNGLIAESGGEPVTLDGLWPEGPDG